MKRDSMNRRNRQNKKTPRSQRPTGDVGLTARGGREPIDFARQLREMPGRLSQARSIITTTARFYGQFVRWLEKHTLKKRAHRRTLALLETQQLGDKRFVAVVRVGKQKFLIGGAATSVSLLAEITPQRAAIITPRPFSQETA